MRMPFFCGQGFGFGLGKQYTTIVLVWREYSHGISTVSLVEYDTNLIYRVPDGAWWFWSRALSDGEIRMSLRRLLIWSLVFVSGFFRSAHKNPSNFNFSEQGLKRVSVQQVCIGSLFSLPPSPSFYFSKVPFAFDIYHRLYWDYAHFSTFFSSMHEKWKCIL